MFKSLINYFKSRNERKLKERILKYVSNSRTKSGGSMEDSVIWHYDFITDRLEEKQ